jgi:hypothetical protein
MQTITTNVMVVNLRFRMTTFTKLNGILGEILEKTDH